MNDITKLISGGLPAKVASKPAERKRELTAADVAEMRRGRRAPLGRIPTPDELAHMINNALTALARGIYWDRGSIINIVL